MLARVGAFTAGKPELNVSERPEATLATVCFRVADRPCTSNLLLRRYLRCGFLVCVVLGPSIITPFTATTAKSGTVTANHAPASECGATLKYE